MPDGGYFLERARGQSSAALDQFSEFGNLFSRFVLLFFEGSLAGFQLPLGNAQSVERLIILVIGRANLGDCCF